jgi:sensor histidine kinase YesM
MKLLISSGTHLFTDTESRIDEIDEKLEELDMVFAEAREGNIPITERIQNWLWNPLILTALASWLVSLSALSRVVTSDQEIIEQLEDREIDSVSVDKPVHQIFTEQKRTWGAANWSMIVLPVILVVKSSNSVVIMFSVVLLIISAIGLLFAFLAGSNSERNIHMVLKIREFAKEDGLDQACLIVGNHHKSGIVDLCEQFDSIEIID